MKKDYFVTDPAFYKTVAAIAIPIALQNIISFGVNIMDSVMLGSLGDLAISGASLGGQPFFLLMNLGFGLSSGGSVLIAQYWGKGNIEAIRKVMSMSMRFVAVASFLFMAACLAFPGPIMRLYSSEPSVVEASVQYLQVLSFSFLFFSISNNYMMSLRAVESVKLSTAIYAVSFFVNIVANYAFIFGKLGMPRLEIRGAALGTVIARASEFLMVLLYMTFAEKKIHFKVRDIFHFDTHLLGDYTKNCLPVVGNEMLWGVGSTITTMIIGQIGSVFVAANSIASVVWQLAGVFIFGVANAAAVVTGKAIGEGRAHEAQKIAHTLQALAFGTGVFACSVILLLRSPVLLLYDVSAETKAAAYSIMTVLAFLQLSVGLDVTSVVGILRGGGDTRMAFLIDCGALWLVGIPLGFLSGLVWHWSPALVYLMMKMDSPIKVLLTSIRIHSKKWIRNVTREDA